MMSNKKILANLMLYMFIPFRWLEHILITIIKMDINNDLTFFEIRSFETGSYKICPLLSGDRRYLWTMIIRF